MLVHEVYAGNEKNLAKNSRKRQKGYFGALFRQFYNQKKFLQSIICKGIEYSRSSVFIGKLEGLGNEHTLR